MSSSPCRQFVKGGGSGAGIEGALFSGAGASGAGHAGCHAGHSGAFFSWEKRRLEDGPIWGGAWPGWLQPRAQQRGLG